ncbi:MAG: PcfJ domain-containing protein, partial [Bacteroidota bacterium]
QKNSEDLQRKLRVKGNTLAAYQRDMQDMHLWLLGQARLLEKMVNDDDWHPSWWKASETPGGSWEVDGKQYQLVELLNQRELEVEGDKMMHCVGDYGWKCLQGVSRIWSLRRKNSQGWTPVATLEINQQGFVEQFYGPENVPPSEIEKVIIACWADDHQISGHFH